MGSGWDQQVCWMNEQCGRGLERGTDGLQILVGKVKRTLCKNGPQ